MASEGVVSGRDELETDATRLIESGPGLNGTQRSQLTELQGSTKQKMDALIQESLKLRSILIRDTLSVSDHPDEIKRIESNLKDVEGKRISLILETVKKANLILGKKSADNERLLRHFVRSEHL